MSLLKSIAIMVLFITLAPPLVYFCVKFGTLAFYKAKQFIKESEEADR